MFNFINKFWYTHLNVLDRLKKPVKHINELYRNGHEKMCIFKDTILNKKSVTRLSYLKIENVK